MLGFSALSSAPIAASGEALAFLEGVLDNTVTTQATLTVFNAIDASISAASNVIALLVLDHPLAQSINADTNISGLIDVNKQLDQNLTATATANPLLVLTQPLSAAVNVDVTATSLLVLTKALSASIQATDTVASLLVLEQALTAAIDATAITTGLIDVNKQLDQNLTATATANPLLVLNQALTSAVAVASIADGSIDVNKQLDQNLTATATANPLLVLEQPLSASIDATATSSGLIAVNKQLDQNLTATATANPLLVLEQALSASISAEVTATPLLVLEQALSASIDAVVNVNSTVFAGNPLESTINAAATATPLLVLSHPLAASIQAIDTVASLLNLDHPLAASLSVAATTSGLIDVNKQLSQNLTATAETSANVSQVTALFATVNTVAESLSNLGLIYNLESTITSVSVVAADIAIAKNLSADIFVNCDITAGGTNLDSVISVSVSCAALLDVDGNTEGSIGGVATEGFSPLTSVVLAQHVESANAATYTITADFDVALETEIMEVSFNDNPANVLTYLVSGNQAFITVNTPADVYAQASTFVVNRELTPIFNTAVDYKVRFNTAVKKDSSGNNFYSGKFYSQGNSLCFLSDDGRGIIDLYEELAPGNVLKLKPVGRIDYANGYVEVERLVITSKYDPNLFFFVESLDSVIPTKEYFTEQNNLLVQSKTVTFPTGEAVEITQYEKQTDIVDLEIYITARSYSAANPSVTVEERTATYVLRVVPDYDVSKAALLQLLAEQEA